MAVRTWPFLRNAPYLRAIVQYVSLLLYRCVLALTGRLVLGKCIPRACEPPSRGPLARGTPHLARGVPCRDLPRRRWGCARAAASTLTPKPSPLRRLSSSR